MPITYAPELPATADLVIIGGGVVGAATAFHAARAGLRPLIVERRPALCTLTTAAAAGSFRLQFDNAEELRLVRQSLELLLNFADVTGQREYDPAVVQQGYLWLTTDEGRAERQRRLVDAQREWGLDDVELLRGDDLRRRFPYVDERVIQARFRQRDGFLDPRALTMGLAAASGATVVTRCAVTGLRVTGGRLTGVETTGGTVSTEAAVIAAGPFSDEVAALAGVALPITLRRRQKVVLPDVPEVPRDAPMTIDEETGTHWRPALRGAYVLFPDPAEPPGAPSDNVAPSARFAFEVLDPASPTAAARVAPFWRDVWRRNAVHWMLQAGQYVMTPDHRPLLGATPVGGLYVNTGYSGHGVMSSPAASRLVIDIITGQSSSEANPFRLDRAFPEREMDAI